MKRLENVLYILTDNSYLHCENESICVKVGGVEKVRIPAHTIEHIVCLCNTTVSSPFIGFCGDKGIGLSFHSDNGKFYGRIHGSVSGNILLRQKQFELIGKEASAEVVRNILIGKLANSRNTIMRAARGSDGEKEQILRNAAALFYINYCCFNHFNYRRNYYNHNYYHIKYNNHHNLRYNHYNNYTACNNIKFFSNNTFYFK